MKQPFTACKTDVTYRTFIRVINEKNLPACRASGINKHEAAMLYLCNCGGDVCLPLEYGDSAAGLGKGLNTVYINGGTLPGGYKASIAVEAGTCCAWV